MKTLRIKRKDIHHLLVTKDFLELSYDKNQEEQGNQNQQEIQDLHERSGKFGKDSDLSDL